MSIKRPNQMDRARAAREMVNRTAGAGGQDRDMELVAFMSIFHPERKDNPRTRAEARRWREGSDT